MNVIIFRDNQQEPLFSELEKLIQEDKSSNLVHFSKLKEVADYIKENENALILFSPASLKEVKILYQFLKKFKSFIRKNLAKIVCSYKFDEKKYITKIKQGGVGYFINPLMKVGDLKNKLEELNGELKSTEGGDPKHAVHFTPPFDNQDDCWILTKKENVGFFLRAYLVKLLGPGPSQINWTERELKDKESKVRAWSMKKSHEGFKELFPQNGEWIFTSDQKPPFFDNKLSQWVFSGTNISLFLQEEESKFIKFESKIDAIDICKNSTFATNRKETIIQSIEDPHKLSFEAEKKGGHLEGEGSEADKLADGNLEGEGSAADEIDGTLEGDGIGTDKIDKHYRNKDPLDTSGEEPSEDEEMDFLDADDDEFESDDDYYEESKEDDMLGDHMFDTENANSDPLAGKSNTDEIEKYYKNKDGSNSPTKDSPGDTLGKSSSDSDPLSGKGGTDSLEKNYDGGLGENLDDEEFPDDMLGENAPESDPLSGKNSTDKIRTKYDGKMSNQKEKGKDPLSGQSGTDKIDNNYSGDINNPLNSEGSNKEDEGYDDSEEQYTQNWKKKSPKVPTYGRDESETGAPPKEVQYGSEESVEVESTEVQESIDSLDIESGEMKCEVFRQSNPNAGKLSCQFEDFFEDNLTLKSMQVPDFEPDEELGITISFKYQEQESVLDLSGVFVYEEVDEDTEEVFLQFNLKNVNRREVESFMEFYQERQKNISKFLNKSRAE